MSLASAQLHASPQFEDHLDLLAEMGHDFTTSLDIGSTLDKALSRISGYLDAEAASLFLLDDQDSKLICRACFGPADIAGLEIGAGQGIVGRSVQENDCQMVRDARQDPDFARTVDQESGFRTRSILCAPMSVKDRRVGAIELLNKTSGDGLFSEQDRRVLQVLATSAALAIINARLTAAVIEQERDRRERDLAAEIQRNLLPRRRGADFPLSGINVPARGVSGDFYDFFELDDGRVGFSIGDVSGKGMNAALLMAKTTSLYRCLGKTLHDPGRLLHRVNAELCETGTRGMFVTMVGGIYDPATGTVHFSNAGHEPPLLRSRDGSYARFPADAPPLGIATDLTGPDGYPVERIELAGGMLLLFTDGVTESESVPGEMLRVEGFQGLLDELEDLTPRALLSEIVNRLGRPGQALHDDLTLVTIDDSAGHAGRSAGKQPPPSPFAAALDSRAPAALIWPQFEGESLLQMRTPAVSDRLKLIRAAVGQVGKVVGCSENNVRDMVIAVDEACQNVIRHAYKHDPSGEIILDIRREGDWLAFNVVDFAVPIDASKITPRDISEVRPGGLGMHFMQECMDEVRFVAPPAGAGNRLLMRKRIE